MNSPRSGREGHVPLRKRAQSLVDWLWVLVLGGWILLPGCASDSVQTPKSRGVYTVLGSAELAPLGAFDAPPSSYEPKASFTVGQVPIVVVRGYDGRVTVEIQDTHSGETFFVKDIVTAFGRLAYQRVPIRKPGEYRVRLMIGKSEMDDFKFSINN